ncbi:hypothetical protein AU255_09420 [Methyloprofundus sedimenti]|uniref:Uncharacterized protein n=1 Tax=Methyloprofundus sedimenti TaxID=1420851 RepID=A0A1V8M8X0_9GAMM|nr:hypothetical protein AU255_09420 [Methyloprofundus sedimenti]
MITEIFQQALPISSSKYNQTVVDFVDCLKPNMATETLLNQRLLYVPCFFKRDQVKPAASINDL